MAHFHNIILIEHSNYTAALLQFFFTVMQSIFIMLLTTYASLCYVPMSL